MLDLIKKTRSYRRFNAAFRITDDLMSEIISVVRFVPSAANLQPLKFLPINNNVDNAKIFPLLKWAGYLPDWSGPVKEEQPTGYIVVLGDKNIAAKFDYDAGLVTEAILLTAVSKNLGGCIFASVDRDKLRSLFNISENLEILTVIALGKPIESVEIKDIENNDIKYYRDENNVHYVPKRTLDEMILGRK